jgi:hypothetical protein
MWATVKDGDSTKNMNTRQSKTQLATEDRLPETELDRKKREHTNED